MAFPEKTAYTWWRGGLHMPYIVIWVGEDQEKHFSVHTDRDNAEAVARERRREGRDAHVVSSALADPNHPGMPAESRGGLVS
jgi:hypothetical protein